MWVRPFLRSFVRSRLWYFLSPVDGASVREAHCEQASTAVREAHCAPATVARLVKFESLKWKYSFATNSTLFMKLGSLLYVRCRHRSAKSGFEQDISFPGNKHLLIFRKCYAVHINASSL